MMTQQCYKYLRNLGYLVGTKINSGSFSIIHYGIEIKSGNTVAIKIIDLENVSSNFRTRFLPRELTNIQKLNHPNIIKVHQISRRDKKIYIVMDYAPSNLHKEIDTRTHINEPQAKKWFLQLTSALEYLQKNGVAHRDVKLENILIDNRQKIKLCDFGFSKIVDGNSTTFCGSLAYCAPEILLQTPYDPWKSDIWSLGVVLYKMVVGVMPFGEGNDLVDVRKIAEAQTRFLHFPSFPVTSHSCQQLIRQLLTVESTRRISLHDVIESIWLKPRVQSSCSASVTSSPPVVAVTSRPTSTFPRRMISPASSVLSLVARIRRNLLTSSTRSRSKKKLVTQK